MDTAIEILSGRTVAANASFRTRSYRCPLCNGGVTPRSGDIRVPYFAHRADAPQNCPLRADQPPQKFVEAMTRAVLQMRIVLVNGMPELIILEEAPQLNASASRNARVASRRIASKRSRHGRRHPDDPDLPSLLGSIVFVRHLGGAFRGHDHRTQPVTWGDDLIVLAEHRTVAPSTGGKHLPPVRLQGRRWLAWHIELPSTPSDSLQHWLSQVGISVEARDSRPRLITPPTLYAALPTYPAKSPISIAVGDQSSRVSMLDAAKNRGTGPILEPHQIQALVADKAMRVRVAADTGREPLEFETTRKPQGPGAAQWSVRIAGTTLLPFSVTEADADSLASTAIAADEVLTFSLTAELLDQSTRTLLAASGKAASQWITRLTPTAVGLVITASDGSSVTVRCPGTTYDAPSPPTRPVKPSPEPSAHAAPASSRRRWHAAYRDSTLTAEHTDRHWQVRDRRRSDTDRRNR